jgi:uncharacterized membrane protein YhiD involved in acid resistance
MIPIPILFMVLQAALALCTVIGYRYTTSGHEKRGHLLIGIGSAGLVLFAPNPIYACLSLFWTWVAATAYAKAR